MGEKGGRVYRYYYVKSFMVKGSIVLLNKWNIEEEVG